jgi:hypothetical protein
MVTVRQKKLDVRYATGPTIHPAASVALSTLPMMSETMKSCN